MGKKASKAWFLFDKVYVQNDRYLLFQKQPPELFCKKGVLKNYANFTGKHVSKSFLNKVAGLFAKFLRISISKRAIIMKVLE